MSRYNLTYREVDGQMIRGRCLQAIIHNVDYYVTTIKVYEDGMIDCWELVDLNRFKQKVRQSWVVTSIPDGGRVLLDAGIYLTATDVRTAMDVEDLVGQVEDEIRGLQGEPTSSDRCRAAYATYRAAPSDATKARLCAAYAAVPKHLRQYLLGHMNGKDPVVRELVNDLGLTTIRATGSPVQGWDLLDDAERRGVWDRFYDDFAFRPSIYPKDFPGIREPHPSITWALRRPWDGDDEVNLHTIFLAAFRACMPPDGFIYVLDWQHDCFRVHPHDFRPQVGFQEDEYGTQVLPNGDYWPVPVLPNGDYYIFLAPDFTWGVFGHPWEWTMCVFGDPLLTAIAQHPPRMFATIVRQA